MVHNLLENNENEGKRSSAEHIRVIKTPLDYQAFLSKITGVKPSKCSELEVLQYLTGEALRGQSTIKFRFFGANFLPRKYTFFKHLHQFDILWRGFLSPSEGSVFWTWIGRVYTFSCQNWLKFSVSPNFYRFISMLCLRTLKFKIRITTKGEPVRRKRVLGR